MPLRFLLLLLALVASAPVVASIIGEAHAVGARIDDNGLDIGGGP
jgi:hypothetical protein